MRKNLPVTDNETPLRADQYLISKTDIKGRITYANPAFVEVSGFAYHELLGQPHNLVRHPDMPPEAFQDFWHTLKSGKPWLGMVKNRRKDGGFYWVQANATPIIEHGEVAGYASVRVKPSESQVQDAESFYQRMNAGKAGGYAIRQGQKTATGWRRALSLLSAPFRGTIRASMFRLVAGFVLLAAAGWYTAHSLITPDTQTAWAPILLCLVTFGLCVYGWRISRRILVPMNDIAAIAQQISAGNLAVEIRTDARDETRLLYFYLDLMRKSLMDISCNVNSGVESTVATATALSQSNEQLEQRTRAQAALVEQTMVNMEQFSASVRQNTDNAMLAGQLADSGLQTAQRGKDVVAEVIAAMQGIHESSSKVADIVAMIEGIAFQTNILALNAAVESARAGEAGKGFAVVASEVRSLAQKSSQAAGEIKTLIEASVARISEGAAQVHAAGQTMQDIMQSVEHTTQVMNEISSASVEQGSGLAQIYAAIERMDAGIHDNRRLVQELGLAATRLSDNSDCLQRTVEVLAASGRKHKRDSAVSSDSAVNTAEKPDVPMLLMPALASSA